MTSSYNTGSARESDIAAVENAVEKLRLALLTPTTDALLEVTSPLLTYGHSSGLVENRETCIESMVSGKYKFLTLAFSEQEIWISGNTAIVRHRLFAETHDRGSQPGIASIHVMQVWEKAESGWLLLARQAVKIPPLAP